MKKEAMGITQRFLRNQGTNITNINLSYESSEEALSYTYVHDLTGMDTNN